MQDIKILDCTLRDGGYLNNWEFKNNSNILIENNLIESNIEFIEIGFLTNKNISPENTTLYNNPQQINNKIVMVNLGEFNLSKITTPLEIRLAFKKHSLNILKNDLQTLKQNNIKFSLNPMHISLYTEDDYSTLFDITNEFNPTCLTAVDTMGIMTGDDTKNIFKKFDKNINKKIELGFHSHNNLNLSMSNIKELLSLDLDRTIILDSSLNGIGRGGGMLSTNKIAEFLNTNYGKNYNTDLINATAEIYLKDIPFYDRTPYFITATNKCHPNYGLYLTGKNCTNQTINMLLQEIPTENRQYYDENIISNLYKKNFLNSKEV